MLETVAILAEETARALPAIDRPAAHPLLRARIAQQRAVLEQHAGHPDRATADLAEAREGFTIASAQAASPLEREALRPFEALLAAEEGRFEEAVRLQQQTVSDQPLESDLVTGSPALWLLAELQARAGDFAGSAASLERLHARVALGSVPFGGHFVLARSPIFAAARRDPGFSATLDRIRPDYAGLWPSTR
jgi:tetratricopeptide (TPR) repeat protein